MVRHPLPAAFGLVVIVACAGALPGDARAQVDVYVTGSTAGAVVDHFNPAGPGTGYEFEPNQAPNYLVPRAAGIDFGVLRLEGEAIVNDDSLNNFELVHNDLYGGSDFETMAGMANAFIDLPTRNGVSPFVGGGIGYASVSANGFEALGGDPVDDRDVVMAYQLRAGFAISILSATELILGYRYFVTDDLNLTGTAGDRVTVEDRSSHVGELGIRVRF
jgi:opacity protein-like surface antigen